MRFPLPPVSALFLAFAALVLASCATKAKPEVTENQSSGGVVDVREGGRGRGRIPASEMSRRWRELERYRAEPLVLRASNRAEGNRAAAVLRGQGFQAVRIVVAN